MPAVIGRELLAQGADVAAKVARREIVSGGHECAVKMSASARRLIRPARLVYRAFLSDVLAFDQSKDDQQDHGADEGVDNGGDKAAADYDAQLRQ